MTTNPNAANEKAGLMWCVKWFAIGLFFGLGFALGEFIMGLILAKF